MRYATNTEATATPTTSRVSSRVSTNTEASAENSTLHLFAM